MIRRSILILLVLAGSAPAATIIVPPGGSLQSAIDRAVNGDRIELQNGTHTGGANFRGKTGIHIRAANSGQAILSGSQIVMNGINCSLAGVIVTGVRTNWNTGAVLVTGRSNLIEDVIVRDNESLGIEISGGDATVLRRVQSNHNGNLGLNTGSPAAGNNVEGLTIEDCTFDGNNFGLPDPVWKNIDGKTKFVNGLWYRLPGDAAGGAKICNASNIVVRRCSFTNNLGPGLWFDVYCGTKTIVDSRSIGNRNIPNDPGWTAPGFAVELEKDGSSVFDNCYAASNSGSGMAIWEARNVTVRNCLIGGNIELRDLGGGREAFRPMAIRLENLKLTGQVSYWNDRTKAQVTEINVAKGAASLPAWTMPGSASPPATQPATQQQWTDGQGNIWTLTAGAQLTLNGTLRNETARVTEATIVDGMFYHLGSGQWWKWTGGGWLAVAAPPQPTTQPMPPAAEPIERVIIEGTNLKVSRQ